MPEVKKERTGWRDLSLSQRHRSWGWNCPATDFDFLEYDKGRAVALVEYKHEKAAPQYASHPTYQAMIDLGNGAQLPVFGVRYAADFSWWQVTALNAEARKWISCQTKMNEKEWVALLYHIRGCELPITLFTDAKVEP